MNNNENKFYQSLEDIFTGANIEGESGYINLLKIKSSYYKKILDKFKSDVHSETHAIIPQNREGIFIIAINPKQAKNYLYKLVR